MRASTASCRTGCLVLVLGTLIAGPEAHGHETDQYSVPAGQEMADLSVWMSDYVRERIERAVTKTNRRIGESLRDGGQTSRTEKLLRPEAIAAAVNQEFLGFFGMVDDMDAQLASAEVTSRFPGQLVSHRPPRWIYHHPMLMIDVLRFPRWRRCSLIMIDGTYLGTDKIYHMMQLGYQYYRAYRKAVNKGRSEEQAMQRAIQVGTGCSLYSERCLFGYIGTGVVSNGDISADYIGLKFYRNLTEPVRLKGEMHPPLLVRERAYYRLNTHVQPNSDFFKVFISDHLNEALNPGEYAPGVGTWVREELERRCPAILSWYRDEFGRPMDQERYHRKALELTTYYGEDYGFIGNLPKKISIANVCFAMRLGHRSPRRPRTKKSNPGRVSPGVQEGSRTYTPAARRVFGYSSLFSSRRL